MWLLPKDEADAGVLQYVLAKAIDASRFTARLDRDRLRGNKRDGVKVTEIRLRRYKEYCGQHPGPCLARFPRKHMRTKFLEGLDWVGFNHLVNDTFDNLSRCCDFFSFNREMRGSGRYYIRKGLLRRVHYPYETNGFAAGWVHGSSDNFQNHCGKPSPPVPWQVLDAGTPGYACYTLEEEDRLRAEELDLTA